MKNYKEYEKVCFGESDIATLIFVGFSDDGLKIHPVHFGGDDAYFGRIVDEDTDIPEHYSLEAEFTNWLTVYDDDTATIKLHGDVIKVYTAGEYGVMIQVIKEAA